MIHISSKTAAILAAFTAVSAPLMLAGCGQEAPKQRLDRGGNLSWEKLLVLTLVQQTAV